MRSTPSAVERLENLENGGISYTLRRDRGALEDADAGHRAIRLGHIRYCPICDGFEAAGKKVAVISHRSNCVQEAAVIRHFTDEQIKALCMRSGVSHRVDTIYSMLNTRVRSELAKALGARCDADDNLEVDAHLQTTSAGLYAVGDVASGLNQISVATGQDRGDHDPQPAVARGK